MIKYICLLQLVLKCFLVARKENLTGVSTGLTGLLKNLDLTGNPTVNATGFHPWDRSLQPWTPYSRPPKQPPLQISGYASAHKTKITEAKPGIIIRSVQGYSEIKGVGSCLLQRN